MPKIVVGIEWDEPNEPFWLNPDNVAVALHAYCKNTRFNVTYAQGAAQWACTCERPWLPIGGAGCEMCGGWVKPTVSGD